MNGKRFGNVGAALLVAGALGLAGFGGATADAQSLAAGCQDPGMMSDQKMDGPMMGEAKMEDPGMMGDPGMMSDQKMDDQGMMGNMTSRARDGQCLASQSAAVQALFAAAFGDGAGARWVQEHEAELTRSGM